MDAERIKYLEMIQEVIKRMATNSFALKGWAVTLIAGIFALSSKEANAIFFLDTYVPVILFWFLDSYYLQLERKYRVLYKKVVATDCSIVDFDLTPPLGNAEDRTTFLLCLFSLTELGFYFPCALLVSVVIILANLIV